MAEASLDAYRRKRTRGRTPEPMPPRRAGKGTVTGVTSGAEPTFVVQEHHASSLHWDFRLEKEGVLVSWALPKGLPTDPEHNHLAVPTEDHPLEYGSFSGSIPDGEYGAGEVTIWDHGSYECEKWTEREVKVVLHGERVDGRFVLFPTGGKRWMIHRMGRPPSDFEPIPEGLKPMLAVPGELPVEDNGWAYEFKWDGIRVLLRIDGGRVHAVSRNGHDVTGSFPELRAVGEALGSDQVLLDGELVALDDRGRPRFSRLQHRLQVSSAANVKKAASQDPASLVLFDLLHLNGRSLLHDTYDERRRALEALGLNGPHWGVTPSFIEESGREVLRIATDIGMEGVVAKRRTGIYRPGLRSRDWVKVKRHRTQEVVIGGWTSGQGNRKGLFGALVVGLPTPGHARTLSYAGKVGTGFSTTDLQDVLAGLRPLVRSTSPFSISLARDVGHVTWVRPVVVGEVQFSEWTPDGRFRHPVWRGLRPDKSADEVVREP